MQTEIVELVVREIVKEYPNLLAIYLFGSFGSQFETEESDLDLALLLDKPTDPVKLWNLAQRLAKKIRRDVDLIDLKRASTVFQFEIITNGELIFCTNQELCDKFKDLVYSMYVRFNDERQEIVESFLNKKTRGT